MNIKEKISQYIENEGPKYVRDFLFPWLSIQSISPDIAYAHEVRDGAKYLLGELKNIGLEGKLIEVKGIHPLVYAESKNFNPNKPTILVYGHNDVQPVIDQKWTSDPFQPEIRDGKIYARGAADDKGQVSTVLLGLKAAIDVEKELPVNVKFLIESNEESSQGSIFPDWVEANKKMLYADGVIVADCERLNYGNRPTFFTGLKGISASKIVMDSDDPKTLLEIVASLYDEKNSRVNLGGFYDKVMQRPPITDPEVLELLQAEKDMGEVLTPENGFDQATHRTRRPTYDPLSLMYTNTNPKEGHIEYTIKLKAKGPLTDLHSGIYGGPVQNPGLYLARALHLVESMTKKFDTDLRMHIDYIK